MDFKTLALRMYPMWILGIFVILATIFSGNKNAVRVEKKAIPQWIRFLCILTVYRFVIFKLFPHFGMFEEAKKNISIIPVPLTLTVFWEDACHGLPLYFLHKFTEHKKLLRPFFYLAMGAVMIEFGMGHLYQNLIPALMLMFYIPYSMKAGEKYGFGTVMICHTLFDLSTALSIKYLLGA